MVLALVARGMFSLLVKWLALRAGQRQGGVFRLPPPYLWTPLSPQRVKGCSPLTIPKRKSKPKNASRFAKRIFLCFSYLRLRRRFHVSAGRYRQQRGNTSCEAANRRNEKKAFSAAASFFPFRQLLRGLKGASSPFLVDPARRNRWCFSGSLLAHKRELSLSATAFYPALRRAIALFLPRESKSPRTAHSAGAVKLQIIESALSSASCERSSQSSRPDGPHGAGREPCKPCRKLRR